MDSFGFRLDDILKGTESLATVSNGVCGMPHILRGGDDSDFTNPRQHEY